MLLLGTQKIYIIVNPDIMATKESEIYQNLFGKPNISCYSSLLLKGITSISTEPIFILPTPFPENIQTKICFSCRPTAKQTLYSFERSLFVQKI